MKTDRPRTKTTTHERKCMRATTRGHGQRCGDKGNDAQTQEMTRGHGQRRAQVSFPSPIFYITPSPLHSSPSLHHSPPQSLPPPSNTPSLPPSLHSSLHHSLPPAITPSLPSPSLSTSPSVHHSLPPPSIPPPFITLYHSLLPPLK